MSELYLREIAFRPIDMGKSADALCRQNPSHRCAILRRTFTRRGDVTCDGVY